MTEHSSLTVLQSGDLEGLELILSGALGPVDGYCLPGQRPADWPAGMTLSLGVCPQPAEVVTLCDPDNTPLAQLVVAGAEPADHGRFWVAGAVSQIRKPEHGIARDRRFTGDTDLSGRTAVLLADRVSASDLLRVVNGSHTGPFDLVAVGEPNADATMRLTHEVEKCAAQIDRAAAWYIPSVETADGDDVARAVVSSRSAAEIIDLRRNRSSRASGAVLLFTGLSGAGKSTIARRVAERIAERGLHRPMLLDGDHVRHELASELTFSAEDRDKNLKRIAWVAARVAEVGGLAICAPIAPFSHSRASMRSQVEPASPFIVIYVSTPLHVAEARDRKGLYEKARAGLVPEFTGISSPYEQPTDADLTIDTSQLSVDECVDRVLRMLVDKDVLTRGT